MRSDAAYVDGVLPFSSGTSICCITGSAIEAIRVRFTDTIYLDPSGPWGTISGAIFGVDLRGRSLGSIFGDDFRGEDRNP